MSEELNIGDDYISIIYITFFIIVCIVLIWLFITMNEEPAILDDLSQNEEEEAK